MRTRLHSAAIVGLVAAGLLTAVLSSTAPSSAGAATRAKPSSGWIPGDPLDCTTWRYGPSDEPASLPAEFDRNDYKRTSLRDPNPALVNSPQNLCGQKGSATDLAWGLSEGSSSVRIAILDSGIEWRDAASMADLATKAYINLGEAKPPCWPAVADGDCNHDGVFNITDFGSIPDLNHNGVADPEDLILNPAYNNHRDDDHDGYVDDISGWDFLYGDNDPLDTVDYGHGTGEAKDSERGGQRHRQRGHLPELPVHPGSGRRFVHRRRRPVRRRRAVRPGFRRGCHPGGPGRT